MNDTHSLGGALFVTLLLIIGCGSESDGSCVQGEGPVVSETLTLGALTGIDFQAVGDVVVVQAKTQEVVVRGEQNVLDRLNQDVMDGVWDIGFIDCVENIEALEIDITVPVLSSVELSGAGDITVEMDTDAIDTIHSGSGGIELSGTSTTHQITLSGTGDVNAFELLTEETSVILSGVGSARVSASELLTVVLSGTGNVFYKGDPELDTTVTGLGDVIDAN